MEGKQVIQSLRLRNLLSFGPDAEEIVLEPLNVLIGPNASGKSNVLESIGLLAASPKDLAGAIRKGGGIREWVWKGSDAASCSTIETTVTYPDGPQPLRHRISFSALYDRFEIVDEAVENKSPIHGHDDVYFFYRILHGKPYVNVRSDTIQAPGTAKGRTERNLRKEDLSFEQSVLSQRKDPDQYPEVTYLGNLFSRIKIFNEWNLGRDTPPRRPQPADLPTDFLEEDARNLGLVLNNLAYRGSDWQRILEKLKKFYESARDVVTRVEGGTIQIFVHEQDTRQPIPATRLSDGTLRYLCLLTILCHPSPPPIVCLEEPELGMHPDILPTIAELLVDASKRTQLIVTTHSDTLVSALGDHPEAIMVCENDGSGTKIRRLEPDKLKEWLKDYSLGELWLKGEIGGTRW
jgi:predicted ATPase